VRLTEITDGVIPAATAVVLKGAPNTYNLNATEAMGAVYNENVLRGVTANTPVSSLGLTNGQLYVLGKTTAGYAAFCRYTGNILGGHRAYIFFANGQEARELMLTFGDETTAIDNTTYDTPTDNCYYNLQGQRVLRQTKGLYIVSGKKLIVK
jgi:hypothetical protein